MTSKSIVKKFAGLVSVIAFLADIITVGLFIKGLLYGQGLVPFESAIVQVILIIVIFSFASLLMNYSSEDVSRELLDRAVWIFGWLYILLAAFMFSIYAYRFIMREDYGLGEYITAILFVLFVTLLGTIIFMMRRLKPSYFSIPYMLVAVEQIILWIIKLFSTNISIAFTGATIGNILLFIFTGTLVIGLIYLADREWSSRIYDVF